MTKSSEAVIYREKSERIVLLKEPRKNYSRDGANKTKIPRLSVESLSGGMLNCFHTDHIDGVSVTEWPIDGFSEAGNTSNITHISKLIVNKKLS